MRTPSLPTTRTQVTKRLAGLELPTCFQLATISAAELALTRKTQSAKASRRRLLDKATRLASVGVQS